MNRMQNCSNVVSVPELKQMVQDFDLDMSEQLYNGAEIYPMQDGRLIAFIRGKQYGLLIDSEECLQSMIKQRSFPINNTLTEPIEYEVENILHINEKTAYYMALLNQNLGMGDININEKNIKAYFAEARRLAREGTLKPAVEVGLMAVLGDYVKKRFQGKWVLRERYDDYNIVYEPYMLKNNGKMINIRSVVIKLLRDDDYEYAFNYVWNSYFLLKDDHFPEYDKAIKNGLPYFLIE